MTDGVCEECGVQLNENTMDDNSNTLCRWCVLEEYEEYEIEEAEEDEGVQEEYELIEPIVLEENESIETNYYYALDDE
jgi:hypothetical protein